MRVAAPLQKSENVEVVARKKNMCGIAGVWLKGNEPDRAVEAASRAAAALAHRGPDDHGLIKISMTAGAGALVLSHRRLSIIDLSEAGHQPMHDPETGNWIVYNGEVYNFGELRADLESLGYRFRSNCDTEVILHSYSAWGVDCVTRWRGMFAAAIWDESRQELFLVRDRLGIKPLYYFHDGDKFLFASELRAILETGLVTLDLSLAALNTYLMFGAIQDPLTMIRGINSLPASHTLTVNCKGISLKEYWELPLDSDGDHGKGISAELIAYRLEEAVRLRLVSDVPLGVFLSGGIDSSALAMLMRRATPDQVKAFTIGFVNKDFDEAKQAKRTALKLGVEHHSIMLTEGDLLASCEEALRSLDQPTIDGINTFYVSRAVKDAGITVALSGLGGDEAFCGYPHFRTVPRMGNFAHQYARLPYIVRRTGASLFGRRGSDRAAKLHALLLDEYGFAHPYFLARTLFLPDQIVSLFEQEALLAIEYGSWGTRMSQIMARSQNLDPINCISYLELKTYVANTLLRDTDATSMAHSLEVRVPLLDHFLLEDVMRLPGNIKVETKIPKALLVGSLPENLPPEVIRGPKRGFTLPFEDWLTGKIRSQVEASFACPPPPLDGIINPRAVKAIWQSFLAGKCSWSRPWALYVLYQVVERLFDPRNAAATPVDVPVLL